MPATDDEVMEVEDFLVDDKTDMHDIADGGKTADCAYNEGSASGKLQLESSEGFCVTLLIINSFPHLLLLIWLPFCSGWCSGTEVS